MSHKNSIIAAWIISLAVMSCAPPGAKVERVSIYPEVYHGFDDRNDLNYLQSPRFPCAWEGPMGNDPVAWCRFVQYYKLGQVYHDSAIIIDAKFGDRWFHAEEARIGSHRAGRRTLDMDAKYETTPEDHDADCYLAGCVLYETVSVSFPIEKMLGFDGFDNNIFVRIYGRRGSFDVSPHGRYTNAFVSAVAALGYDILPRQ